MNAADRKEFDFIHNKIDDIKKDIDNSLIEDNRKGESVDEVTCNHLRKQIKEMEEHHNLSLIHI